MDWRTYYKEHTMTPEQAVSVIHDGDRVVFGHAVGEPIIFQRTMAYVKQQVQVHHVINDYREIPLPEIPGTNRTYGRIKTAA